MTNSGAVCRIQVDLRCSRQTGRQTKDRHRLTLWHPLLPYGETGLSRIFNFWHQDSGHSDAQGWASEWPDVKNYKWRLNPVWHRMLYSCTHMATVGVKGLISKSARAGVRVTHWSVAAFNGNLATVGPSRWQIRRNTFCSAGWSIVVATILCTDYSEQAAFCS